MYNFNQQNPSFLTNTVYNACDQARVYYLDTLYRMQDGRHIIDDFKASKAHHKANLEQYREEALKAASADNIDGASTQLAYIVMEWAFYKAHGDLINANGAYLDAADPDVANDFDQAVEHKVVFWATELSNYWIEGYRQREKDLSTFYTQHQKDQLANYQQVVQTQGNALTKAHEHNKMYAGEALGAIKWATERSEKMHQQAGQNVQWMGEMVEKVHQQAGQNVNWMGEMVQKMHAEVQQSMQENLKAQKATTETIVQNMPREMEKAQARIERRKIITRGIVTMVLIAAVPLAIGLAWFLLRLSLGF